MNSAIRPINKCFPAGVLDPTPLEQLSLRDNLIAEQEKEIAAMKALLREYRDLAEDADLDLRQGTPTQRYGWCNKARKLEDKTKELLP